MKKILSLSILGLIVCIAAASSNSFAESEQKRIIDITKKAAADVEASDAQQAAQADEMSADDQAYDDQGVDAESGEE